MSRPAKIAAILIIFAVVLILVGQCSYGAGEWIGRH
jgi:hypothetical protein